MTGRQLFCLSYTTGNVDSLFSGFTYIRFTSLKQRSSAMLSVEGIYFRYKRQLVDLSGCRFWHNNASSSGASLADGSAVWGAKWAIGSGWSNGQLPIVFSLRCFLPIRVDQFAFKTWSSMESQDPMNWLLEGARYVSGPWLMVQRTLVDDVTPIKRSTFTPWFDAGTALETVVVTSCAAGATCAGTEFRCNTTNACAGSTLACLNYTKCSIDLAEGGGKRASLRCPIGAPCKVRCGQKESCDGAAVYGAAGGALAMDCGGGDQSSNACANATVYGASAQQTQVVCLGSASGTCTSAQLQCPTTPQPWCTLTCAATGGESCSVRQPLGNATLICNVGVNCGQSIPWDRSGYTHVRFTSLKQRDSSLLAMEGLYFQYKQQPVDLAGCSFWHANTDRGAVSGTEWTIGSGWSNGGLPIELELHCVLPLRFDRFAFKTSNGSSLQDPAEWILAGARYVGGIYVTLYCTIPMFEFLTPASRSAMSRWFMISTYHPSGKPLLFKSEIVISRPMTSQMTTVTYKFQLDQGLDAEDKIELILPQFKVSGLLTPSATGCGSMLFTATTGHVSTSKPIAADATVITLQVQQSARCTSCITSCPFFNQSGCALPLTTKGPCSVYTLMLPHWCGARCGPLCNSRLPPFSLCKVTIATGLITSAVPQPANMSSRTVAFNMSRSGYITARPIASSPAITWTPTLLLQSRLTLSTTTTSKASSISYQFQLDHEMNTGDTISLVLPGLTRLGVMAVPTMSGCGSTAFTIVDGYASTAASGYASNGASQLAEGT